jgi:hypothetical protein
MTGNLNGITPTQLGYLTTLSSNIQDQVTARLLIAGGTMTGNLNGITPTKLGYLTSISSNVQDQLTARLPLAGGTMTGNLNGITPTKLGYLTTISSNVQTQLTNHTSTLATKGIWLNAHVATWSTTYYCTSDTAGTWVDVLFSQGTQNTKNYLVPHDCTLERMNVAIYNHPATYYHTMATQVYVNGTFNHTENTIVSTVKGTAPVYDNTYFDTDDGWACIGWRDLTTPVSLNAFDTLRIKISEASYLRYGSDATLTNTSKLWVQLFLV